MANIGQLVVKIAADASQLTKELDKIAGGGTKATQAFQQAGKIMAGALLATASAAVVMTLRIAEQAEETEQLSQKTGITVQTLQSWSVVMAQNGLQAQQLATAMTKLSKEMLEAQNPASAAAQSFQDLGVSIARNSARPKIRFARSLIASKTCRTARRKAPWRCNCSGALGST
jgi:hypothetical protein